MWKNIFLGVAIFVGLYCYFIQSDNISYSDFRKSERYLNARIDTINMKLDTINAKIDRLSLNNDTIKMELRRFSQASNAHDNTIIDYLKNLWN